MNSKNLNSQIFNDSIIEEEEKEEQKEPHYDDVRRPIRFEQMMAPINESPQALNKDQDDSP